MQKLKNCSNDTDAELISFARKKKFSRLKKMLEERKNIDAAVGAKLLMHASREGELEVVKMLRKLYVDINATDESGMTALMWAAFFGRLNVVRYLLDCGVNVNARNLYEFTALGYASLTSNENIANLIKNYGGKY